MQKIPFNSEQNKYFFIEGDHVFELEKPIKNTKEIMGFFSEMFKMLSVSWEVYVDAQTKEIPAFALHDAPLSAVIAEISMLQTLYKIKISKSYQIV